MAQVDRIVVPSQCEYTLQLTFEEALLLKKILGAASGNSPIVNDIFEGMSRAGVNYPWEDRLEGSIYVG
ncbi:hypothetical protein LCGC14_3140240 [marine sediment metagenome]|uniref:Uncharacterized protein n=1 Tax=marine sediment metagenome TaxID=412755 RepID=A0A0F8VX81_9ZZZZ